MFIRGLSDAIKAKLAHWGKENILPGDILLTNDPQVMGSHLNHMIFTLPIFHEGELVAFRRRWRTGRTSAAYSAAVTRDIYSEGLQMPFVKIFKSGKQDEEMTAIIRSNCRFPELAMGDFRAQIAAIRTGERRFDAVAAALRRRDVQREHAADLRSERGAGAAGGGDNSRRRLRGRVVHGRRRRHIRPAHPDQGPRRSRGRRDDHRPERRQPRRWPGSTTPASTAGRSAAQVAFKCLTSPLLLPINDGSFRPLKIMLPPGRIVSATKPAPVRTWMTVPMTVADTIFKALAPRLSRQVSCRPPCRPGGAAHFRSRSQNRTRFSFSPDAFGRRLGRSARPRRTERDFLHQRWRHP